MRVLLAEDGLVTRRLFSAVVGECGHDVESTGDGAAAWAAFERAPAPLVILDWLMPVVDGLELCRRIRASIHSRGTYILMATSRAATTDVASALEAGADDFITKPVTAEHLRAQIIIAERRMSESAARSHAERELAHSQWLAGIGQTAIAMQHEINNPLTSLLIEVEFLASDPDMPAKFRAALDVIALQGDRIGRVVQVLADLKEPTTLEAVRGVQMIDLSGNAR